MLNIIYLESSFVILGLKGYSVNQRLLFNQVEPSVFKVGCLKAPVIKKDSGGYRVNQMEMNHSRLLSKWLVHPSTKMGKFKENYRNQVCKNNTEIYLICQSFKEANTLLFEAAPVCHQLINRNKSWIVVEKVLEDLPFWHIHYYQDLGNSICIWF